MNVNTEAHTSWVVMLAPPAAGHVPTVTGRNVTTFCTNHAITPNSFSYHRTSYSDKDTITILFTEKITLKCKLFTWNTQGTIEAIIKCSRAAQKVFEAVGRLGLARDVTGTERTRRRVLANWPRRLRLRASLFNSQIKDYLLRRPRPIRH